MFGLVLGIVAVGLMDFGAGDCWFGFAPAVGDIYIRHLYPSFISAIYIRHLYLSFVAAIYIRHGSRIASPRSRLASSSPMNSLRCGS